MRIIGGIRRGKRLHTPINQSIRPTSDRVRESIFNILAGHIAGARVLDLFAGTGAMGLEALSRDAEHVVFIENQPSALTLIDKNIRACGWSDRTEIIRWDLRHNLKCLHAIPRPFTLVFTDPPYGSQLIPTVFNHLHAFRSLRPGARVVVEHALDDTADVWPEVFDLEDRRTYGKTLVSFFRYMV